MNEAEAPGAPLAAVPRERSAAGPRRLLLNAGSLLLAYVLPRLFILGAVVVAARVLGAGGFGAYSTAAAFAVVLSIAATLGMVPLLIRDIARAPERAPRLLGAAHRVKTLANAVMLAALLVLARWILDYPAPVVVASLLLGLSYAVGAYAENFAAYFQAVERMHVWTEASAAFGVVTGGLGVLLVLTTRSLTWFCVAPVVGQTAALLWLLARAPAELRRRATAGPGEVRRLLGALAPFAAGFVALTIYYKLDVLLLARWRTPAEVGVYAAAYKFVDIVQALAIVAAGAVYPRLARATARPGESGRPPGARIAEVALVAALPLGGVLWLLRAPLIHAVYGPGYEAAAAVLALLALLVPALAVNIVAGYALGAVDRMYRVAGAYAVALALNLALNAALIPAHGPPGAAATKLVTELLLALALLAALRAPRGERGSAPDRGVA